MESVEAEMRGCLKVWIIVVACLTYCYFISARVPKGKVRLLSLLPILSIFVVIPLNHTSFFLQFYFGLSIGWLANFKLLLLAFGKDDDLSINPSISLFHFILVITLPIKIKVNPVHKIKDNENFKIDNAKSSNLFPTFLVNLLIWSFMVQMYVNFKHHILLKNPVVVHILYSARMFFGIQVQLFMYAAIGKSLLGQELEPQFDNPHFATSLTNFWGKRWNLMVSNVLKHTIYEPTRSLFTPMMGRRCAIHPAILTTYAVSGFMHEMIHFYVGRCWPTWEVMWFFMIHGVCFSIEVEMKKKALKSGWKLHPVISVSLTVGFVMATGIWLCYAELIHWGADVREVEEYAAFVDYVKQATKPRGMFATIVEN